MLLVFPRGSLWFRVKRRANSILEAGPTLDPGGGLYSHGKPHLGMIPSTIGQLLNAVQGIGAISEDSII